MTLYYKIQQSNGLKSPSKLATIATRGNRTVVLFLLQNQVRRANLVQPSGTVFLRGAPKLLMKTVFELRNISVIFPPGEIDSGQDP